jgi:hypothetical protein
MTTIVVASCFEPFDQTTDFVNFPSYERYPGFIWYRGLALEAAKDGYPVIGAAAALALIEGGQLRASDVLLVQEQKSARGEQLMAMGATGAALTCLESPLYAANFYAGLPSISRRFHSSFLFPGFTSLSRATHSEGIFYPRDAAAVSLPSSGQREGVCIVATHRKTPWRSGSFRTLSRLYFHAMRSPVVGSSLVSHLLTTRIDLVRQASRQGPVSVYGRRWPAASRISPCPDNIRFNGAADDKREVLRQHRFTICLENTALGGYVTEKLADAVEAGCVPIYASRNLADTAEDFDLPFVDAQTLLRSADPRRLLDDTAARFDEWACTRDNVQRFLSQFHYAKFAEQVMRRLRSCPV